MIQVYCNHDWNIDKFEGHQIKPFENPKLARTLGRITITAEDLLALVLKGLVKKNKHQIYVTNCFKGVIAL